MTRPLSLETPAEMELRLRRLEDAVAALQDTSLLEERVAERVSQRARKAASFAGFRDPAGVVIESSRAMLPPVASLPMSTLSATSPAVAAVAGSAWLPWELWSEVRLAARMVRDSRYSLSPTGRYGPAVLGVAYLFIWFFTWSVPFIGGLIERAALIAAVLLLYKLMSREVRRYQTMVEAYNARGAA